MVATAELVNNYVDGATRVGVESEQIAARERRHATCSGGRSATSFWEEYFDPERFPMISAIYAEGGYDEPLDHVRVRPSARCWTGSRPCSPRAERGTPRAGARTRSARRRGASRASRARAARRRSRARPAPRPPTSRARRTRTPASATPPRSRTRAPTTRRRACSRARPRPRACGRARRRRSAFPDARSITAQNE